jgi:hypothetical protein
MKKVLVSGGCSFAYGFNLIDRDDRYSKILSREYDLELIDTSTSGASNENIAAATVTGVHRALQKYKPREIVVVVGWTDQARFEYWDKSIERIQSAFINHRQHANGSRDQHHRNVSDFVIENMWTAEFGYYRLIHAFNYLNSFCKAHGVVVINKPSLTLFKIPFEPGVIRNSEMSCDAYTENVIMPVDIRAWESIFVSTSFHEFTAKRKQQLIPGLDSHPNPEGHRGWADKMKKEYGNVLGF